MSRLFKYVSILVLALCAGGRPLCAQGLDSTGMATLEQRLTEYFDLLRYESIDVQKAEADFMIEASSDSLIRQFTALRIYDHYIGSKVMGAEAVAIHIFDKWFLPGRISMGSDMDLLSARIFADFNRQSQIGEYAPELIMETMDGDTLKIFGERSAVDDGARHSVLFFYDADCARCKVESILLGNLFRTGDYPVDLYAVYTGDNRTEWEEYVAERFDIGSAGTAVIHLWDPVLDSDFQRKYGVIQTPRLFLIRPDGKIKGRGLDVPSLALMLEDIFERPELEYGKPASEAYLDRIFGTSGREKLTDADICRAVDRMALSGLHSGDTVLCRQLVGDMLYYLAPKTDQSAKEGLRYLLDSYILGRTDIWKSKDDSLKVIGFAQIMDDLLSKSVPGTRIAGLKVPGELLIGGKKTRNGVFPLQRLRADKSVIIFYTEGCQVCEAEKAAARTLAAQTKGLKVLMVNVDRILAGDPALASRLFDSFDLTSLPYILITDRKGIITARYVTLQ